MLAGRVQGGPRADKCRSLRKPGGPGRGSSSGPRGGTGPARPLAVHLRPPDP